MSNIILFNERTRNGAHGDCAIIRKIIDGKVVEYVNVDALNPAEQQRLFSQAEEGDVSDQAPAIPETI